MRHLRTAIALLLTLTGIASGGEARWWRGNTHTHTVLCGHADSTPEVVAAWYLDRGYHFLCLSEHNRFIDPKDVKLPPSRRRDFLLVPGEEITGEKVHMTALGTDALVAFDAKGTVAEILQLDVDRTRADHAVPIINHPNFVWQLTGKDMRQTRRCHLFELYNGHPQVHNDGDATHPSTEAMWNALLDDGMVIYGVSSDDAHHFQKLDPKSSNPGRGWVMVRSPALETKALCGAMDRGDFYASSGVFLAKVEAGADEYRVEVDAEATGVELAKGSVALAKPPAGATPKPGWRIEFIGPGGAVVRAVDGRSASCPRDRKLAWLRAKVTLTQGEGAAATQCFAWTQPVFHDGRLAQVEVEAVRAGWADEAKQAKR
jgi:hypothetical protein